VRLYQALCERAVESIKPQPLRLSRDGRNDLATGWRRLPPDAKRSALSCNSFGIPDKADFYPFMLPSRYSARCFALIPAAGAGARMNAELPKQYLALAGKPMLAHAMLALSASPSIEHVYVVVSPDDRHIDAALESVGLPPARVTVLRVGGLSRQASVLNGLQAMSLKANEADWVLVHDAARPGLTPAMVDRLVIALRDDAVGGLLALPIVDTLKKADEAGRVIATVARQQMWAAQTPQMFRYGLLVHALASAVHSGVEVTDEASAVEALGMQPRLIEGSSRNFKVTLPQDVALAELYLKEHHD
jgi:2-C-methyl-D-erythritol 4-phosphate cytidylyltransferase